MTFEQFGQLIKAIDQFISPFEISEQFLTSWTQDFRQHVSFRYTVMLYHRTCFSAYPD